MKSIKVRISSKGEVELVPSGFGSSCTDVSSIFSSLGETLKEEDTEEMWEPEEKEKEVESE